MKKLLLIIAALSLLFAAVSCGDPSGLFGVPEPIEYEVCSWDAGEHYVSRDTKTVSDYIVVKSDTTEWENGKTYVVTKDVKISSRVTVNGVVDLVICNGAELHAPKGIDVGEYDCLSIYGQYNVIGSIKIDNCDNGNAGIGNGGNPGRIVVHCANINVTGGTNCAAIGGGPDGNGGEFVIYDGNITAVAKEKGAGIGGGKDGDGAEVTIYGGHITATGTGGGAGIGGGYNGAGGNVYLYKVQSLVANGSDGAMGIGRGAGIKSDEDLNTNASGIPVTVMMSDDSSFSVAVAYDPGANTRKQYMRVL